MKKSKLTALLLTAALAATSVLSGCGGSTSTGTGSDSNAGTTAANNTPAATTAANNGGSNDTAAPAETAAAPAAELTYADGTVLRMACGYNSDKTGMSFTADLAGEGITLADGNTYQAGDL